MATQVQFRRGTTTQNNAFTGAIGEITYDSEVKTLRLHDGSTAGGGAVVTINAGAQTLTNKTMSTNSVWQGTSVGLAYGGTAASLTAVAGGVLYSGASALAISAAGTSGQVLTSAGSSAPTWTAQSSLSVGTATTATTASNINGGSAGYLVYQVDTNDTDFIPPGASGTFLRSTGASTAPDWATASITIGTTEIDLGQSSTSLAGLNILASTGTSHWTLPNGTTLQRPASPAAGMIRYNSTQSAFEGYASGAWSSLGGVKSVDGYTYIIAETSPTAGNGDLDFYAENSGGNGATQVGQWNRTNLKDYTGTIVGTQTTQNVFNTTATTVNAFGAATTLTIGATSGTTTVRNNLEITGNFTVNGTTTTINATSLAVDDNIIKMAEGNAANILDIGFVGNYTSGSALHTGLIKQASSSKWLLLSGIAEPTTTVSLTGAVYDWLKLGTVEVTAGIAVNGSSSGTTTIVATAAAGTTTLTLPAATDTLVGRATTDTLTNKTLTSPILTTPAIGAATGTSLTTTGGGVLARAASTQDGIEIRGRAGGTGNWEVILTPTTLTADRTFTFPDHTGTILSTGSTSTSVQFGSFGVGTAASGTSGEIRATNAVTSYYSDDRLKTRTGNIQNALEKVLSLDGFHYYANETAVALGYDASKQEVGLSAQQVQAVLPEVIAPAPIDPQYMTMHYERLVPLLVEAIKEQQKQIEELKAKLGN